ncbi:MAG: rod shape-determining protein RodA [Phycisphaerae bacterium]|nr:rod shape-determining protein RodA [Phycisphaerae bacterium]
MALTTFGLLSIYAGEAGPDSRPANTIRQTAFLAVGLAGFVLIQLAGYRRVGRWAYPLFGLMLILLTLLVIARAVPMDPLISPRRNAYRWIVLGPVSFQVSEYTKVIYILALSAYLRYRTNYRTFRGLLGPFVLTLIPMALILKEPDLGTSILLLPTLFVMLYAAGAKNRHLLLILALGAVTVPIFYFSPLMNDYQRRRIQSLFRQDDADKRWRLDAGYQLNQSKIALGSGRTFGQGFRGGAFFRYNLLPEEHNDFIFAVLGHQWGFVGCMAVLSCYLIIVVAGLTIASMTTDAFGRLLAVGVCALIFTQTVINVGMTMGLMPITGMSLPFVSMGGSGLVASYLAIGLLADVAHRRPISVAPKPFEFDHEDEEV